MVEKAIQGWDGEKTPSTLWEFMDRADNFVNAEDTLQNLIATCKVDKKNMGKEAWKPMRK